MTAGQPAEMASKSPSVGRPSCRTVSRTISSCGSIVKVTWDGFSRCSSDPGKVSTSRSGRTASITVPVTSEMPEPSVRTCCQVEPGCQSDSLRWPQ